MMPEIDDEWNPWEENNHLRSDDLVGQFLSIVFTRRVLLDLTRRKWLSFADAESADYTGFMLSLLTQGSANAHPKYSSSH